DNHAFVPNVTGGNSNNQSHDQTFDRGKTGKGQHLLTEAEFVDRAQTIQRAKDCSQDHRICDFFHIHFPLFGGCLKKFKRKLNIYFWGFLKPPKKICISSRTAAYAKTRPMASLCF